MDKLIAAQRQYFNTGDTRSVTFRKAMLTRLEEAILKYEPLLTKALQADLNKPPFEAYATEIGVTLSELRFLRKHLKRWSAPRQAPSPITIFPARSEVCPEPYGVVLIMSPWNYPVLLTLAPLLTALAAGNCAVVKPSAYAPETAKVLARMLSEAFPKQYVAVVEGGRAENTALLDGKFDYIFFTGSTEVGRTVMAAAARHLIPVTLELGGKSPCIIADDANLELAAKRIAWGKFLNAGQTCVAPDHIWVKPEQQAQLIEHLRRYMALFYTQTPLNDPKLPRIVNEKHYKRLCGLIEQDKVAIGGKSLDGALRIEPTVMINVTEADAIMEEEIFGPILPMLNYDDLNALVVHLREKPKPLALYLFTSDRAVERKVMGGLSFGGGCVNDTIVHLLSDHVPFGGVGESGMGSYHGKAGFDTFSHYKTVIRRGRLDVPLRYPPYSDRALRYLKKLM